MPIRFSKLLVHDGYKYVLLEGFERVGAAMLYLDQLELLELVFLKSILKTHGTTDKGTQIESVAGSVLL